MIKKRKNDENANKRSPNGKKIISSVYPGDMSLFLLKIGKPRMSNRIRQRRTPTRKAILMVNVQRWTIWVFTAVKRSVILLELSLMISWDYPKR